MFLLVACSLACTSAPNNNNSIGNGNNGNSTTSNVNSNNPANANNSNGKTSIRPLDENTKTVAIVVSEEKNGRKITAIPDIVTLELAKNQSVHFAALDALNSNIESIEINFGKVSPLEGGPMFNIGAILPGGSNSTDTGRALMSGTFKYTISVRVKGLSDPLTLDPQVEISGGMPSAK
jgi:hypothetical protein